jgi:DNA-binding transcriptional regulator YiaG
MTGAELKSAAIVRFGEKRWQKELAAYLRSDVSTVRRWTSGRTPIPGPVQVAVQHFDA